MKSHSPAQDLHPQAAQTRLHVTGRIFKGREFAWSFYSQGTKGQGTATDEFFFNDALRFFGETQPGKYIGWDKGRRLAGLVARERSLLILDGLEPMLYGPGPMP